MSAGVVLSPGATRQLRRHVQLADELRRQARETAETRRIRLDEREHCRRAIRDLEREQEAGRGGQVVHRESDAKLAAKFAGDAARALERERARLATIEDELAAIAEREKREAPHRAQVANFTERLILATGYDSARIRDELEGRA